MIDMLSSFKEWFNFNHVTGDLTWLKDKGRVKSGDIAGKFYKTKGGKTYGQVKLNQKLYMTHRVCFLMYHGYVPDEVDHDNGDGTDNRIKNLNASSRSHNGKNVRRNAVNTSGVTGVSWDKRNKKWYAFIKVNGVMKNLGRYVDLKDAISVRKSHERLYNFNKNHGEDRPL